MRTVFGRLADPLGHAHAGGRAWATPASSYRREQDARVMIDRDHDGRPVGEIVFLARQREGLWAVGEVSDEVTETVAVRVGGERVEVPSRSTGRQAGSVIPTTATCSARSR
jgi:hypothetical protein